MLTREGSGEFPGLNDTAGPKSGYMGEKMIDPKTKIKDCYPKEVYDYLRSTGAINQKSYEYLIKKNRGKK